MGASRRLPPRSHLAVLGFTFDSSAHPHVTLARSDGGHALPAIAPPRARVRVDALVLYESRTLSGGARYAPLSRAVLAGSRSSA